MTSRVVVAALLGAVALLGGCRKDLPLPTVTIGDGLQERGAYLANHGMACVACHSTRDWTKLGGPPLDGARFAGSDDIARTEGFPESFSFHAVNLTPVGMGAWSDGEIARAVAFGQSKDRRGLFPLMPYREYREHVSVEDLSALVSYLRSLAPIARPAPPPPKFPIPGFVMDGFPEERALPAKPPAPATPAYGAYVTGMAACVACHTNVDNRGKAIGPAYAGGREFPVPAPGKGIVRSANLTPDDDTGLGRWTREQFIARFKAATLEAARAQSIEPGGYNTVMPWWAYADLTDEDLGAMYDHLRTLPPTKALVVKHTPAP